MLLTFLDWVCDPGGVEPAFEYDKIPPDVTAGTESLPVPDLLFGLFDGLSYVPLAPIPMAFLNSDDV